MKTFFLFFLLLIAIPATVVFSQDAGIKKYGNVAFADPVNHKYPIDTKAHIQGSWRSIHVKSHASKYSKAERDEILNRIQTAGEAQGIHFNK